MIKQVHFFQWLSESPNFNLSSWMDSSIVIKGFSNLLMDEEVRQCLTAFVEFPQGPR